MTPARAFCLVVLTLPGTLATAQESSDSKADFIERTKELLGDPDSRDLALRTLVSLGPAGLDALGATMRVEDDEVAMAAVATVQNLATTSKDATTKRRAARLHAAWLDDCHYLITDYSENAILRIDRKGNEITKLEEQYGLWDADVLPNGNMLICQFALGNVIERNEKGRVLWKYTKLKNPFAATRLRNGNTLIANTHDNSVVEVNPKGLVVWDYHGVKATDAERLPNGNTLIADSSGNRILEVNAAGKTVWEIKDMEGLWDVDRLANGNTLVTQRDLGHRVFELTPAGRTVYVIENLVSPSDADRLPNGNTIVACDGKVLEFDAQAREVWSHSVSWAVEVNWIRAR